MVNCIQRAPWREHASEKRAAARSIGWVVFHPLHHRGSLRADKEQESLKNSKDARNLRLSSTRLSSLLLFVHSNLKTFCWCMPEAPKWKSLKNAPPFNTRLQLTTVWSGCWLPNRSSCHDLRDAWNSTLGLSSSRHHPLCSWCVEGDLREGLAAKTLRLNESFQMGSLSKLMFS